MNAAKFGMNPQAAAVCLPINKVMSGWLKHAHRPNKQNYKSYANQQCDKSGNLHFASR